VSLILYYNNFLSTLQEWILRIVVVCSKGQLFLTQNVFIHPHPPTEMCERIMWLFSCAYSCIWRSTTPSYPRCTHTQGTHASKFCTPECREQLLQERSRVLVSTHRSRFQSFNSKLVIKSVRRRIPS
jgi:hypothetical protein